jgi:hypothetical protein
MQIGGDRRKAGRYMSIANGPSADRSPRTTALRVKEEAMECSFMLGEGLRGMRSRRLSSVASADSGRYNNLSDRKIDRPCACRVPFRTGVKFPHSEPISPS